jgi:LacI family transcriptional regulator
LKIVGYALVKSFTMPPPQKPVVTLKAIAQRAGVSQATVSYALRRHPKIPEATRDRITQVATSLGYRVNPRIASLMAHIRAAHAQANREQLAFVWVHTTRTEARKDPFLRAVFAGALERTNQIGFALEEFWTTAPGMTDRRLERILRARGIVGVVLSPVTTAEARVTLDWDWSHFAPAVIGNVTWSPEMHHAGHHHFLGMRMLLQELEKLGCVRPAAVIERKSHERSKHAWEAAFLTHHRQPEAASGLVRVTEVEDHANTTAWLQSVRCDAVVVSNNALLENPTLLPSCRALGRPVFTLYWENDTPREIGGVDQCYDRIAGHAVDLVAAQLNANETGAPELARIMLFQGRWVPPQTRRRAQTKQAAGKLGSGRGGGSGHAQPQSLRPET